MRWADSGFLSLLWFLPFFILFYIFVFRRKKKGLEQFAKAGILEKLLPSVSFRRQYFKAFLVIIAFILLVFSIARPRYGVKDELVTHQGVDIMLAIDVSASMNAEDIKPSRLERVKLAIKDILAKLDGDRAGLIAFSGESILECPLTIDYGAVEMLVDIMDTNIIQEPGTNMEKAIETAMMAFEAKERLYKVLIIITDGENHLGDPVAMAKKASEEGIVIYTIGVGSQEGAPIPTGKDQEGKVIDTKKDRYGVEVISRLDEDILKKVAEEGNGKYFPLTPTGKELEEIISEIMNMEKKEFQSKLYTNYIERFQYPLFIAFVLLILEFMFDGRARAKRKWSGRFE